MAYTVMLSYSWNNTPERGGLVAALKEYHFKVLYDREQIPVGKHIQSGVDKMIESADCLIVLLTKESVESEWIKYEIKQAKDLGKKIVPMVAEDVSSADMPQEVQGICHFPYQRKSFDNDCKQICDRVRELADECTIPSAIFVVGSGNVETVLVPDSEITLMAKHLAKRIERLGGSGLNFAMRLLAAGKPVLPFVTLGHDHAGQQMRKILSEQVQRAGQGPLIQSFIDSKMLFGRSTVETPTTTILVDGGQRTIFSQKANIGHGFRSELEERLDAAEEICGNPPAAVIIGHIQADKKGMENGECTKMILRKYAGKSLIYTVLGNSQLSLGPQFWEDAGLFSKIDVFQLNVSEAKEFFAQDDDSSDGIVRISSILRRLKKKGITTLLTMDQFGAIGSYRDERMIYVTRPMLCGSQVIDSTGAGDAFAAGLISVLVESGKSFDADKFTRSMTTGNQWAACACRYYGGTGAEPDKEFDDFMKEFPETQAYEAKPIEYAEELLSWIDLAYSQQSLSKS